MELRPYQTDAIQKLRDSLRSGHKRPILVAPCGFGKTIVAAEIARSSLDRGFKVLFLTHRRMLAYQTKAKFDAYGLRSGIIMSGEHTDHGAEIKIAMIQTYSRRMKKESIKHLFFHDANLVIVDECHLGIAASFKKIYEMYEGKTILGLTGTPARGDQKGLGEVFDDLVVVENIKSLQEKGFLVPVRYFAAKSPDLSGIKTQMGDYNKKQLGERMNQTKLLGEPVSNWLRLGEDRQTIVYAVNVKHSIALRDEFRRAGVPAEHLDAYSTDEEREDVCRRFENGDVRILTNCQMVTEGWDAPFVSCVVLARPTKSYPLFIQMTGRGLRINSWKQDVRIIDHSGNIERHGFLEDDVVWSLDGREKAWKKPKTKKKGGPVRCQVCQYVFTGGRICPDCGSPVKTFGKKIRAVDAVLEEISPGEKKGKESFGTKRIFYGMLKWEARTRGYKEGWVSHKYKDVFKVWPNGLKDTVPIRPNQAFRNYLLSERKRYFAIKKARENHKHDEQQV